MRICVPTTGDSKGLDEEVSEHFGRSPFYMIMDEGSGEVLFIKNISDHMGGVGKPPEYIAEKKAEVILCGGLGQGAIGRLRSFGIEPYVGATGTAGNALIMFREGRLRKADEKSACKNGHQEGHHGHHHDA
jgi:predicted Fe-Mo cluster-binding NifX family protein